MQNIHDLLSIMRRLRDPVSGCPWDVQQDFSTIAPYTIEEAYEVADAIQRENMQDLKEELGDLLLQVVFHAQMASEQSLFSFENVVDTLAEKLIRRHPHVFADQQVENDDELHRLWEKEKQRERQGKNTHPEKSLLDDITSSLPPLKKAEKIQKKVRTAGFDWPNPELVVEKVQEEVKEVEEILADRDKVRLEEEIGDLLFSVVNLARHLKIDSESALGKANRKFEQRFRVLERNARERNMQLDQLSLGELEVLWQEAKNVGACPAGDESSRKG